MIKAARAQALVSARKLDPSGKTDAANAPGSAPSSAPNDVKVPAPAAKYAGGGTLGASDVDQLRGVGRMKAGASPLSVRLGRAAVPSESTTPLRDLAFTPEEIAAYRGHNAKMVEKNPGLAFVLADPDAFVADMRERFAQQKAITPNDPYQFNISDIAGSTLEGMKTALDGEITKVEGLLQQLAAGEPRWIPDWLSHHDDEVAEHKRGLEYLKALKGEVEQHLESGDVSYRRMQEVGFFVARALGMFDMDDIGLKDRVLLKVDRYLQGYQDLSPSEEYRRYQSNDFSVFQKESPVGGFQKADQTFEEAFFNKDKMEIVSLPTTEHLGPGPFMRLVSYDIYLMGMTPEPAAADGFVRPGGDFWIHDMRHSSAIFHKRKEYESSHGLSEPQIAKLEKKIDLWKDELNEARRQVPDKELRYAIGFFMFNLHHDRGYPMVPSSYLKDEALNHVPKLLYTMLKASGQPVGFDRPLETMNKAFAWLQDFWLARLDEEKAILEAR